MTEDEAKTKRCPMVEYATTDMQNFRCCASGCMMWREDLTREEAQNGYPAKSGHCGLAGTP